MVSALLLIAAATPLVVAVLGFALVREGLKKASERGGEVEIERKPWRTYVKLSFPIQPSQTGQAGRGRAIAAARMVDQGEDSAF
jgi:hypothetical protein